MILLYIIDYQYREVKRYSSLTPYRTEKINGLSEDHSLRQP